MTLKDDPVINVLYAGIKEPIQLCMKEDHPRAALQLMYAAIDALAKLGLPKSVTKCTRADYGAWCKRYFRFNNNEKVEGLEWFAARSGFLHNYSASTQLSKKGKVRMIGYYSGEGPDVIYKPNESKELVMVRVDGLIEAFYKGLDQFVIDLFEKLDEETIQDRFDEMIHTLPFKGGS